MGFRQKDPPGMRLRLPGRKRLLGDQALIFHHQELLDLHLVFVEAGTGRRFGLLLSGCFLLVAPFLPTHPFGSGGGRTGDHGAPCQDADQPRPRSYSNGWYATPHISISCVSLMKNTHPVNSLRGGERPASGTYPLAKKPAGRQLPEQPGRSASAQYPC